MKNRLASLAVVLLLAGVSSAHAQYAREIELLPVLDQTADDAEGDALLPEPLPGPAEEVPWYVPPRWMMEPSWTRSIELGVSGSAGNSSTGAIRVGYDSEIESEFWKTVIDIDYNKAEADTVETKHNALGSLRADRELDDSPWTLFIKYGLEYDEFRDFDLRLSGSTGFGYSLLDNDIHSLTGSLGAGFSRELGGIDDEVVPEGVLGVKYSRQLTSRQKISFNSDYMPSWNDLADFRLESKASWEIVLEEAWNMSLMFSLVDRYDSTPGTRKPNDLDYSLVILWKL